MDWEGNFRGRMEAMRTAAGMTQTDLARVLRERYGLPFHQATIQRIEAGERPVRLNEAHLIAHAFQTDLDTMTSGYGTSAVVTSNLSTAAKIFMVQAGEISDFLNRQTKKLQWHISELRKAWDAYVVAQGSAGVGVDSGLADSVAELESIYRTALVAIGRVIDTGRAENLYRIWMALDDAEERRIAEGAHPHPSDPIEVVVSDPIVGDVVATVIDATRDDLDSLPVEIQIVPMEQQGGSTHGVNSKTS